LNTVFKHCAIALGSNLGDRSQILDQALDKLDHHAQIKVVKVSHWYCSKAITIDPSISQPDYLNGCAILATSLNPFDLLAVMLKIESQLGRVRRNRWDARTLDLDLLLYDQQVISNLDLIIPHPRMIDRAFVMIPLAEIAPNWMHPIANCSILELANQLTDSKLEVFR
jgi:2-amino-4-hydroxy-6-hydroxymethyldihydropteridine diphosphokinase